MESVTKLVDRSIVLLSVSAVVHADNGDKYVLLNGGHKVILTDAEYDRLGDYITLKNRIETERTSDMDPNRGMDGTLLDDMRDTKRAAAK